MRGLKNPSNAVFATPCDEIYVFHPTLRDFANSSYFLRCAIIYLSSLGM